MRRIAPLALVAATLLVGCSWEKKKEHVRGSVVVGDTASAAGSSAPASTPGGHSGGEDTWIDPEPPGAQALAEQVVAAPWNADKLTQLRMSITTLESRTTGLQGFATGLAPAGTSLDERLARLGAEVTGTEVTIRLPGSVLFDFDSADIRADAQRTLSEVAEVLKGYAGRPARVEGHTDAVASDQYNQKLSERRAEAVRAWLAAHGVDKARLTMRGHGESKPVADNATAEGRQRNRRVEVIIEKAR